MSRNGAVHLCYQLPLALACLGSLAASTLIPSRPDAKTNADFLVTQRAHLLQDISLYEQATGERITPEARRFIEQAVDHTLYTLDKQQRNTFILRCLKANEDFDEHPLVQLRAANLLYNVGRTGLSRRLLVFAEQAIGTIGTLHRAHAECLGLLAEIEQECGFFGDHRPFYVTHDRALLAYAQAVDELALQRPVLATLDRRFDQLTDISDREAFAKLFWDQEDVNEWTRQMLMGRYHADVAWQLGGDRVPNVDGQDGSRIEERLLKASDHYRQAHRLDPSKPEAAARLIMVAAALGTEADGPRTWFERSVAAQMDYGPAYTQYILSLRPRWGGSLDGLRAFGEACRDSGRFDTDVPLHYLEVVRAIGEEQQRSGMTQADAELDFFAPVTRLLAEAAEHPSRQDPKRGLVTSEKLLSAKLNYALNADRKRLAQQLADNLLDDYDPTWSRRQGLGARRDREIDLAVAMPPAVAQQAVSLRLKGTASPDAYGKRFGELAKLYRDAMETASDSRAARLLQQLAREAESNVEFYQGNWTLLPFDFDYDAWLPMGGTWTTVDSETIEGRRARDSKGMMLYSDNSFPGPIEVEVEVELLDAYGVQPRAGLVIGYLPVLHPAEGFSGEPPHGRCFWIDPVRGWAGAGLVAGPTTVYAAPREPRYTLRVKAWPGFYAVLINDQFVFQGNAPSFQPDGYVGVGALSHSRSSNECRFHRLKVRRLTMDPPPMNAPAATRVTYFTRALEQSPQDEWALAMRGVAHFEQGQHEAAVVDLKQVVDDRDPSPRFAILLATALGRTGRYEDGMTLFEQNLKGPAKTIAADGLAWLLATCPDERLRDGARAVTLAQQACQKVDFEDSDRLDTLAAAYAEVGKFAQAIRWQTRSIEISPDRPNRDELRDRLEQYKANRPYHTPRISPPKAAVPRSEG